MTKNSINSPYRLYYNTDGSAKFYTMEELEGDFIYVDHATFEAGRYDVVVKNGRLKSLSEIGVAKYHSVTQSTNTTVQCDPSDILLVTTADDYNLWDYRTSD